MTMTKRVPVLDIPGLLDGLAIPEEPVEELVRNALEIYYKRNGVVTVLDRFEVIVQVFRSMGFVPIRIMGDARSGFEVHFEQCRTDPGWPLWRGPDSRQPALHAESLNWSIGAFEVIEAQSLDLRRAQRSFRDLGLGAAYGYR